MTSPHGSTITRPGGLPGQVYLDGYGWVQPIRSQRGDILYYADPVTGERIQRKVTGPASGPGGGNTTTKKAAQEAVEKRAKRQEGRPPAGEAPPEWIWLDGQVVKITRNGNGTWTATPPGGGKGSKIVPPTAFDALDGNALDPKAPFLMAPAATRPNQNWQGPVAPKSMMTVGGAAGWLAELSTRDKGAYEAMLEKLHNANYLSDADLAAAAGRWSSAAGTAFALAARDVAVVNTTVNGANTDITQFLDEKKGAYQASQAKAYKPVERAYTDPEDIKASAKSEAEQFLGRQLTDAEENQLVTHFRGLEDAMYDTIDSAGKQGTTATYTKPGSGQIDHFVEDTPATQQEGANFRAGQYGQALKRLFGVATGG